MSSSITYQLQNILSGNAVEDTEIIARLRILLEEHNQENRLPVAVKPIADLIAQGIADIQDRSLQNTLIKSGFPSLDEFIGGFLLGELVILGARPGMGKTQWLINIALNIAKEHPVLYCSLELSSFLVSARLIATQTGISIDKILQQKLTEQEQQKMEALANQSQELKLFVDDNSYENINALKEGCGKEITDKGIKVLIVDYLQLLGNYKHKYNRDAETAYIIKELKAIAQTHRVCVLLSSQLSRAVETRGGDKKPQLSDLRDSGSIEQDSDKVFFLYRPDYYMITVDSEGNSTEGMVELIIGKNRNGPLGIIHQHVNANITKFSDLATVSFDFSPTRLNELL